MLNLFKLFFKVRKNFDNEVYSRGQYFFDFRSITVSRFDLESLAPKVKTSLVQERMNKLNFVTRIFQSVTMMQIFIDLELEEKPSIIKDRILSDFILAIMLYTGFLGPFISTV